MTTIVVPASSRDPYREVPSLGVVAVAFYAPLTSVAMGPGSRPGRRMER
jgi:hypothetical protein